MNDYTTKLNEDDAEVAYSIGSFTKYNLRRIMEILIKNHYERCAVELPSMLEVVKKNIPIHMLKGNYPYTCLSCGKVHHSIEEDNFCSFCGIGFIWVKKFPKIYHRKPNNQDYFIRGIYKLTNIQKDSKWASDFRIDYWDKTYKRGKYKEVKANE